MELRELAESLEELRFVKRKLLFLMPKVCAFPPNSREAVLTLNQCLASVMGWLRANKLKLNSDKAEVLLVSWKADEGLPVDTTCAG